MNEVDLVISDTHRFLSTGNNESIHFIWDDFFNSNDAISVPALVEKKAAYYRTEFLAWTETFSASRVDDKSLYTHLQFEDDLPYWWMTSIGQRFNIHNGSRINDVIKTMAFVDYLEEYKLVPKTITVATEKPLLAKFFRQWAKQKGYEISLIHAQKRPSIKKTTFFLYGLSLFRFVIYGIFSSPNKEKEVPRLVFFDIFTHLKAGERFQSNYWTKLVEYLEKKNVPVLWNHLYYKTKERFSFLSAVRRAKVFNTFGHSNHLHIIAEQNFGLSELKEVYQRYKTLKKKGQYILPKLSSAFFCSKREIDLNPLLYDAFKDSLCGKEALKNCFYSVLMQTTVNKIPATAKGVYIQEFQPWEIALVHYWTKTKKQPIIGMPHSTIRYWDLRYFFGPHFFKHNLNAIFPDTIAVNGDYALERCLENGYPKERLKKVEALRYLYHDKTIERNINSSEDNLELLICCDYQLGTSRRLLELVDKAVQLSSKNIKVSIRMHPAFPLPKTLLEQYNVRVNNQELITALQQSDWVVTSNLSAIAVDAFYQGCQVAQLSDGLYFNLSPLKGVVDHLLFTNAQELNTMFNKHEESKILTSYFSIEQSINGWKEILSI